MKFVRWLGAFGKGSDLFESATWELSQVDRQVAAEPLCRGRSLLSHAKIGLVIDTDLSRFHAGWLQDAWTKIQADGTLRPKYKPQNRQGKKFRNMDRFLKAWNACDLNSRELYYSHAEVVFDCPVYSAVVVKHDATEHGKKRAARLAANLGMKLVVL